MTKTTRTDVGERGKGESTSIIGGIAANTGVNEVKDLAAVLEKTILDGKLLANIPLLIVPLQRISLPHENLEI